MLSVKVNSVSMKNKIGSISGFDLRGKNFTISKFGKENIGVFWGPDILIYHPINDSHNGKVWDIWPANVPKFKEISVSPQDLGNAATIRINEPGFKLDKNA